MWGKVIKYYAFWCFIIQEREYYFNRINCFSPLVVSHIHRKKEKQDNYKDKISSYWTKMYYLCNVIKTLIISLPMLVCIFWSALLLLDWWEQRTRAKARMLIFMVVSTALYGGHFIFFNHYHGLFPFSDTIYCMANLAVFPLYYLYIKEVTEESWQKHWQVTLLLPALLIGTAIGTLYLLMDGQETQIFIDSFIYGGKQEGLSSLATAQAILHISVKVLFALQIPPILVKGFQKIKHYDKQVETNYADTYLRKLYMVKTILVLFVAASVISFTANILGRSFFDALPWLVFIPATTFTTLLFLLGHAGHKQNFTIEDLVRENTSTTALQDRVPEPHTIEEKKDTIEKLKNEIERVIEQEQMFLQQDLKINDVAMRLHTNRNYIYQAINVKMGVSFSEYINRLRIAYAIQLKEMNPDLSSSDIAFRSGFSSRASFYRNMKLYQNYPPLTYRNKQQQ